MFDQKFNKQDFVYIFLLVAFCFTFLLQIKDIQLSSYANLVNLKNKSEAIGLSKEKIIMLPPFIGIFFALVIYVSLRLKFSRNISLFATLLIISSSIFINNFSAGSFSSIISMIFNGNPSSLIQVQDITVIKNPVVILAIFGLFSIFYNLKSKKEVSSAPSLSFLLLIPVLFILSFFIPILFFFVFAFLGGEGLNHFLSSIEEDKENKITSMLFGSLSIIFFILYILNLTPQNIIFSIFGGILCSSVIYLMEQRYKNKINFIMLIGLFFISIMNGFIVINESKVIDNETLAGLEQIKNLEENKISIASVYGNEIVPAAKYLTDKEIDVEEGVKFLFDTNEENTNATNLMYILIDTLILDDPKKYLNEYLIFSPKFETFAFGGQRILNNTNYLIFVSKNNYFIFFVDKSGRALSDKAIMNGEEIPIYRFIELNATKNYYRYIYPKGDTNLNLFKLLFPEKFGTFKNLNVSIVWISNSSRMRLYKIARE